MASIPNEQSFFLINVAFAGTLMASVESEAREFYAQNCDMLHKSALHNSSIIIRHTLILNLNLQIILLQVYPE